MSAFDTAPSPQTPYNAAPTPPQPPYNAASGGAPGSGTGTPLPLISYNSLNGVLTFPTPDLGGNAHGARSAWNASDVGDASISHFNQIIRPTSAVLRPGWGKFHMSPHYGSTARGPAKNIAIPL